jgi:two-component system sensor histidine kinase ChvG
MFSLRRLRLTISRIWLRLLAFNLLLLFLPIGGLFYFEIFEGKLLEAQERSMVQQGRLVAAALSGQGPLDEEASQAILGQLRQQTTARIRVVDTGGELVADTSLMGPNRPPDQASGEREEATRGKPLYRLGLVFFRAWERVIGTPQPETQQIEFYSSNKPLLGPEVVKALQGRYGATWRVSPGQRSVSLYSAIPIQGSGQVIGAVLVTQSTFRVLEDLYEVRLFVFKLIVASVLASFVLSILVATTIARPLRRLQQQALSSLKADGEKSPRFPGSRRLDEIGDLSRALNEMSERLSDRIDFIESFAADVAHEFRNPLASIRTATEMASQIEEGPERQRFLGMVQSEVARMEQLLGAVRQISWIDSRLTSEVRTAVNLRTLLVELTEGFRLRYPRILFQLDIPEESVFVKVAHERLVQVFENIVANSVSFSGANMPIGIALRKSGSEVVITVSDQGPGIPEEHLERIFDRFFSHRPENAAAESYHAGLGLAIVKTIVQGFGGVVRAENRKGGGLVLEVRLPAVN